MWRQGDVLIAQVDDIPAEAQRLSSNVLAEGEITGHRHQIIDRDNAELFELDGIIFVRVTAPTATIVHDEHKSITLSRGLYRTWRQREYSPDQNRPVYD